MYFRLYPSGIMKKSPKLTRMMTLLNLISYNTTAVLGRLDRLCAKVKDPVVLANIQVFKELFQFYIPLVCVCVATRT